MKKSFLYISAVILFYSCFNEFNRKDIAGTYTRYSKHEFGSEYDTIHISVLNPRAGAYKIIRNWKYERVMDGMKLELEQKTFTKTGFFDHRQDLLKEMETGLSYTLNEDQNILYAGTTEYKRIK
jgi:hypothetical protein